MTTTYELYTNENGTPKAVEGKAPAIIERVENIETSVENLETSVENLETSVENLETSVETAQATADACLPLTGGTLDGSITFTTTDALKPTSDESYLAVLGGTVGERGANLQVYGESNPHYPGHFILSAGSKNARCNLWGKTNGGLEWCGKPVAILNGSHFSQPGYYIIGSLCIQWGVVYCAKDNYVTVNFATPFTSLASITTSEAPTNAQTWNLQVSDLTNSYVTFYSAGTERYVRFIAIGMA